MNVEDKILLIRALLRICAVSGAKEAMTGSQRASVEGRLTGLAAAKLCDEVCTSGHMSEQSLKDIIEEEIDRVKTGMMDGSYLPSDFKADSEFASVGMRTLIGVS